MTLADLQKILNSSNETPEGKAILILQLVSGAVSGHANDLFGAVAAFNHAALQGIASAMQRDAANMIAAAKAAAVPPTPPKV